MVSRSRTRIILSLSEGFGGASSGKNFRTGSSMLNLPSATARPTAVEVKLLLSECMTCGLSGASGFHQPSATTCPWRTSMKLCMVLTFWSAASTYARMSAEETPCSSGVLRGREQVEAEEGRHMATRRVLQIENLWSGENSEFMAGV